ncbi:DUF4935 domain-containing protein [Methylophilus sp. 13]|uniref:PIN domain-containing protein n=1 Tax=Methylophilus sp. 13 TaxID=2781018 RepID=UPI00188E7B10|nr:PIN domain-containing protein [Methylophilus sp. 13]MBF5039879.1 DUF4935 domain-containing protein [Methylophilus sp. 13]
MLHIFIDTNPLYSAGMGLNNGEFRKLLFHSKAGQVKLYIPFISWEERRTQILEEALKKNKALRKAHSEFSTSKNLFLDPLPKTPMFEFDDDALKLKSKEIMAQFAKDHGIEILQLGEDHAQRAWTRFFEIHPPFSLDEADREVRRKDIPDSWILEAAIDLKTRFEEMVVFGKDGKLTKAIQELKIDVIGDYEELFERINRCISPVLTVTEETTPEVIPVDELEKALLVSQQSFMGLEKRVLGYIAYFDPANKDELFETLSKQGIGRHISENIAQRLVLTDAISDSGNNYLIKNKSMCELAASAVEDEIIKMLADDKS